MEDCIIAPLDCDELDAWFRDDTDRAYGELSLLSEAQLTAQAVSFAVYLETECSFRGDWQALLAEWNAELEKRARPLRRDMPPPPPRSTVYLLHLDTPLSPNHTAQHYIGQTYGPVVRRLNVHRNGAGARFTQVACERAIGFFVARTWPGDKRFERRLKNRKCGPKLCPICNPPVRRPCVEDDTSDIPF